MHTNPGVPLGSGDSTLPPSLPSRHRPSSYSLLPQNSITLSFNSCFSSHTLEIHLPTDAKDFGTGPGYPHRSKMFTLITWSLLLPCLARLCPHCEQHQTGSHHGPWTMPSSGHVMHLLVYHLPGADSLRTNAPAHSSPSVIVLCGLPSTPSGVLPCLEL